MTGAGCCGADSVMLREKSSGKYEDIRHSTQAKVSYLFDKTCFKMSTEKHEKI